MSDDVIPKYITKLFEIGKKSELKKYSRTISITLKDFASLICNCNTIGYIHQIRYKDFIPQHLILTEKDRNALGSTKVGQKPESDALTAINKMGQIFIDRKYLIAHLFHNFLKWHLFFFDQRDFEAQMENHWKEGSHIHFVNYLWTQYRINTIDDLFDNRNFSRGDTLHIRFENPDQYESQHLFT